MSDKKLVGEAKRKADCEEARKIVGTKPKKPTAELLSVSAVVGNRGKVRRANPVEARPLSIEDEDSRLKEVDAILDDVEAKISKLERRISRNKVTQDDLNDYYKESISHHSAEGYSLVREIETRLKTPWWQLANKGETLPALLARAILRLAMPVPAQTVVVVESKPVPQSVQPRAVQAKRDEVRPPQKQREIKHRAEGPSNKEICYKEWLKTPVADIQMLIALVPAVKDTTVKQWVKKWEQNDPNWLPACAKSGEFPTSMRAKN